MIARENLLAVRERISDEGGFTLIELLVGMIVGSIVITAAVTLVLMSLNASARVNDKVAGLSKGRVSSEQIEQRLHSATCLIASEYAVNGTTNNAQAATSLVFAGPTEAAFFADISSGNGATNVGGSVGFLPYLRYLYLDNGGPTSLAAGRRNRLMEGWRIPSTSVAPFNYSTTPLTGGPTNFDPLSKSTNIVTAGPTNTRVIADLVTNSVSGATSLPVFQYFDGPTTELTPSATTGGLDLTQLDDIDHIRVNYRLLAESGKDKAVGSTGPTALDNRTVQFTSDIYLRNSSGDCSAF